MALAKCGMEETTGCFMCEEEKRRAGRLNTESGCSVCDGLVYNAKRAKGICM